MQVVEVRLLRVLGLCRKHDKCFLFCRTYICAVAASCTVGRGYLHSECVFFEYCLALRFLDACRSCGSLFSCHKEWTDRCVRTYECTSVALDTVFCFPLRNVHCNAAFLVCCCAVRNCAVCDIFECAYVKRVSALCVHYVCDFPYEFRSEPVLVRILEFSSYVFPVCRNIHFCIFSASVYGCIVHLYDVLAFLAVALVDCLLHICDSILVRDDTGNLEECRLEDGVGPSAETDLRSDLCGVDYIK